MRVCAGLLLLLAVWADAEKRFSLPLAEGAVSQDQLNDANMPSLPLGNPDTVGRCLEKAPNEFSVFPQLLALPHTPKSPIQHYPLTSLPAVLTETARFSLARWTTTSPESR